MRVVRYDEFGPADVLRVVDAADPVPGEGQVLLRTERVGLNYIDAVHRSGTGGAWQPERPGNLSGEVVGRVERTGPGVRDVQEGDRVAALVAVDACADLVVADADWAVPVPPDLDAATATVLPMLAPLAAGLVRFARTQPGETVLVHTAAGGVGHLAVQLAKAEGARVVGSTGTAAKADAVRGFGADEVVDTWQADWAARLRELQPGGVDVILDALGAGSMEANLGVLAPYGRMVVYGALDRQVPAVDVRQLLGLRSVAGYSALGWRAARPDEVRAAITDLTERLRSGALRVAVAAELPLQEAATAHKLLEDRSRTGRVVLTP